MAPISCRKDVVPFAAMVVVECAFVGLNVLYKAASSEGLSFLVFTVYSYIIATLVLFPFLFFFNNRRVEFPRSGRHSLLLKIFFIGLCGFLVKLCSFKGIAYSSATLASAMSNLTPAFTFILAIIFRMEKLDWRSRSAQVKIMGTALSVTGACIVTLYKGQSVFPLMQSTHPDVPPLHHLDSGLNSSNSDWAVGGLLLATEYLIIPVWYIVLTQIMKEYPEELVLVFMYNLCAVIVSSVVVSMVERDINAWKLSFDVTLGAVIYSGVIGSSAGTLIHTWAIGLKGPFYVAMFRPLSIAIAALMSTVFLGESLYLGSVIGATVISVGFYLVLWGKARDEEVGVGEVKGDSVKSSEEEGTSLIQSRAVVI